MRYFGELFGETTEKNAPEEKGIKRDDLVITKEAIDRLKRLSDAADSIGFDLTVYMSDENTLYTLEGHDVVINSGAYKSEENLYVPEGTEVASSVEDYAKGYLIKDEILKEQRKKVDSDTILTTNDIKEIEEKVAETSRAITNLKRALCMSKNGAVKNVEPEK